MSPLDPDATLPPPAAGPPGDHTLNYSPGGFDNTRTLPPSDAPPAVAGAGRPEVPGFEILQELGRGGMGVVYLARQLRLNRPVALKMVLAGGHASAQDRMRFLAEAESVAAIQHPGIVQVFEFGTAGEQPYFALEFCPGGSLAGKLAGTPLPPQDAAALVERIAAAVQAAHDKGIVHRDLKPDNVLFAADGTPKVTDFGLARKVEGDSGLTRTGAIMGTPSYMAPEQATGKGKEVGPAADVYALGAVLYECLTGRPPFRAATALDTVLQVANDEPVSPRKLVPNLPRDLETVTLKCLEKGPAKRYESAAHLAADLGRFRAGEPILARPLSLWERYWRAVRRRPALNLLILLSFVSVGAAIGTITGANRSLRRKQSELERAVIDTRAAEQQAEARRTDAEVQRQKAQHRLEKAVEAVDKMMVRVAGERWANRPDLADERRQVLEEAVAFFQSFGDEDSNDPIVRRQAARAHLQTAVAYMALGDYPKGEAAVRLAADLYAGLAADAPTDADAVRGRAEATAFRGHFDSLSARYDQAVAHYREAVGYAEQACRLAPGSVDAQVTRSECYIALGHFYTMQDPARSVEFFTKALAVGEELSARPGAPYRGRLAKLVGLTYLGLAELSQGQPAKGAARLEAAHALAETMAAESPPTARAAELFGMTRTAMTVYRGMLLARSGKRDEAAKSVADGITAAERLVAAQPRSFPLRVQLMTSLLTGSEVYTRAGRPADATAALKRMEGVQAGLVRDYPQMTWITGFGAAQRSGRLVDRARQGDTGLDAEFESLVQQSQPSVADLVRYNWACAHAQLAKSGPAADQAGRAERAVQQLVALLAGPYFRNPVNAAHLDKDTDLDPVRGRADYKEFREKVRQLTQPKK
ncbi:MAG: serine/threonine-protein kinase [Gemmataceae bacterium]